MNPVKYFTTKIASIKIKDKLKKYFTGFDSDKLECEAKDGKVQLTNIQLKTELLENQIEGFKISKCMDYYII